MISLTDAPFSARDSGSTLTIDWMADSSADVLGKIAVDEGQHPPNTETASASAGGVKQRVTRRDDGRPGSGASGQPRYQASEVTQ